MGKPLSIRESWGSLRVLAEAQQKRSASSLKEALAAYHEWQRLSHRDSYTSAIDLAATGDRVVIVGGPGAGKSTLLRRAAFEAASSEERVLIVHLPFVQRRMRRGQSIDGAILDTALDGYGVSTGDWSGVLDSPDCLLADGLDECDPGRVEMAEALNKWAAARPDTRVIVATRPIGHDPAYFSGWLHAELLPLDDEAIRSSAGAIVAAMRNVADAADCGRQFAGALHGNGVASLAARNPLLLGFLAQLFAIGHPLGARRSELYEQIIRLWDRRPGREADQSDSAAIANRILQLVGWLHQTSNIGADDQSREDLVRNLARSLVPELGVPELKAAEAAEQGLNRWEERGILERLRVGPDEAETFVHLTIGEFAAATYAASLGKDQLDSWLSANREDPRWHEVIVLASGVRGDHRIVERLLELDDPEDVTAVELPLAAMCLGETSSPPQHLLRAVLDRTVSRLQAAIPAVAYESTEAALHLAATAPELVAELTTGLVSHPQVWTRLCAMQLQLHAGVDVVDLDALEHLLDLPRSSLPGKRSAILSSHAHAWNQVVELGVAILARARRSPETRARLRRLASRDAGISIRTRSAVLQALHEFGEAGPRLFDWKKGGELFDPESTKDEQRQADIALLDFTETALGLVVTCQEVTHRPRELARLVYGLRLPSSFYGDWLVLSRRSSPAAVVTVLRGLIAALGLNPDRLAVDIAWCRVRLADGIDESLYNLLPQVVVDPQWTLAAALNMAAGDLVTALEHPSEPVAIAATYLLAYGAGGDAARELARDTLTRGKDQALRMLAAIAYELWQDEAEGLVLARLEGPLDLGCRWLFRELPAIVDGRLDARITRILERGVTAQDSRVATMAAEALKVLGYGADTNELTTIVRNALSYWSQHGACCDLHGVGVTDVRCPQCSMVPDSPRASLVRLASHLGELTTEELCRYCDDARSDVSDAAVSCVMDHIEQDLGALTVTVEFVRDSSRSESKLLDGILSAPAAALVTVRTQLLELLHSNQLPIRLAVLGALGTAQWLPRNEATRIVERELNAEDPDIRDRAMQTLRTLRRVAP